MSDARDDDEPGPVHAPQIADAPSLESDGLSVARIASPAPATATVDGGAYRSSTFVEARRKGALVIAVRSQRTIAHALVVPPMIACFGGVVVAVVNLGSIGLIVALPLLVIGGALGLDTARRRGARITIADRVLRVRSPFGVTRTFRPPRLSAVRARRMIEPHLPGRYGRMIAPAVHHFVDSVVADRTVQLCRAADLPDAIAVAALIRHELQLKTDDSDEDDAT